MRSPKKFLSVVFLLMILVSGYAQSGLEKFLKPSDSLNKPRRNAVIITEASLSAITLISLDQLWYKDFERSKFRTINDNSEWLQMDKLGHVMTAYYVGNLGADVLNWSGVRKKDQLIYGATLGFTFLTAVEVFDGFSQEWGFSWGDMVSNAAGTGLYVGQELLWDEQRIRMKFSFHQTQFAMQRPEKLGENFMQEILKDYNGQTYWLSANVNSFFKNSKLPKWLNIAVGYGAEGMLTGDAEPDNILFPDQDRIRQYYLSLDLDLSKIETNSGLLRTVFEVVNFIKIPAPTLELNSKGKLKAHFIYF